MSNNILQLAQYQQPYSGSYAFTITHEPDEDYRKYLTRQVADYMPPMVQQHPGDAQALDISLDDLEGDVVAGVSAVTYGATLAVDLLWVGEPLRGQGIGTRLMQMAEEFARERGCDVARVSVTGNLPFFIEMGYELSGTIQQVDFRAGSNKAVYWLTKVL
jgi:GNAT superfamily N-acetyltransferase